MIVATDYASTRDRSALSKASISTLHAACLYASGQRDKTFYFVSACTDRPDVDLRHEDARVMRISYILDHLRSDPFVLMLPSATNSIDEAANTRMQFRFPDGTPPRITIFCDRFHVRRLHMIWQRAFPTSNICIQPVRCSWDETHAGWLQRRWYTWAAANVLMCVLMRVFGRRLLHRVVQPT